MTRLCTVIFPCVHLNGTSKQRLLDALEAVYDQLAIAVDAMKEAAPNGRDYYIGNHSFTEAEEQHRERMKAITDVAASIEAEMDLISSQ